MKTTMGAVLTVAILSGCGGATYQADIESDGAMHVHVEVNNDSQVVDVAVTFDPDTRRVTGFEFRKRGTESRVALKALLARLDAAIARLAELAGGQ